MASLNKVTLIGNIGRAPELRHSADGFAICNLSLATTHKWKDRKTNEQREETEWHSVVMLNKLAEIAGEYLKKGRSVYIEGRLRTRKYTDKQNIERYSTEIIADHMQMLGSGDNKAVKSNSETAQASKTESAPAGGEINDEDLPF